jgi:hypothetical protein
VFIGKIPKWAWIILALRAFNDALLWLRSPYLMIPLILIALFVVIIFLVGGKDMVMGLLNTARMQRSGIISGITAEAAKTMLKKN